MLKRTRYRLADKVVDPAQCTILNDGNLLKVELRAMQVLLCLINHAGEPVSRDMLLDEVWSGGEVSDNAINRIIGILRNQLGDNAKSPEFIKTLPKVGYVLIAPITLVKEVTKHEKFATEVIAGAELDVEESKRQVFKRSLFATLYQHAGKMSILMAGLLSLLLFSVYQISHNESSESPQHIKTELKRLTYLDGQELSPMLSTDGKYLTFAKRKLGEKNWRVGLMTLGSRKTYFLDDPFDSQGYPAFSPDGNKIAYLSFNFGGGCQINMVDINDGEFGEITKITDCKSIIQSISIAWHPSGKSIYYTDEDHQKEFLSEKMIFSIDITGKNKKQLSQPYSIGGGDYLISLSPNGRFLAVVRDVNWDKVQVMQLSLETGNWQKLFPVELALHSVGWSRDSESIIYRGKGDNLMRYDIESKSHIQLTNILQPILSPISSPSGGVVAVLGKLYDGEIWKLNYPFDESGDSPLFVNNKPVEKHYIASNGSDSRPSVSLDGKQLAFVSTRTGESQIWLKSQDGTERQLTYFEDINFIRHISFSDDGTQILGRNNHQAFIYDLTTNTVEFIDIQGGHELYSVVWGPDKQTIMAAFDILGKSSFRLVDIKSGEISDVLAEEVEFGQFSNTGQLYFTQRAKDGLWTIENGDIKLVHKDFVVMLDMSWTIVDQFVYNLAYREGRVDIDRIDLNTGQKVIMKFVDIPLPQAIAVDREGSIFLGIYNESNTNIVKLDY
ncbi:winged helix-turn-helix domain-containing protein [Shewanella nanhaiensis]|uniref:Winged helix-turn-helix domain-containing protein n=1 Tax=Shewanella nanhaiensis TaxID=2864872 RepID=A0ABS7E0U5_9GAMM|nr:winged helix-turn-helix domain-containing protein [Shewanella nanhaiensis]MBW8182968.1 winged helix-turn-helix domain-containing protein [Shewanella nanhaiensis]